MGIRWFFRWGSGPPRCYLPHGTLLASFTVSAMASCSSCSGWNKEEAKSQCESSLHACRRPQRVFSHTPFLHDLA